MALDVEHWWRWRWRASKVGFDFEPGVLEALRELERAVRNDECAAIASGFRNTRQQNLHDYLDKRVAKRAKVK
jgi:hypothetical protein